MRDSSPPEAVSATGPNGRPAFGLIEKRTSSPPVGPGSRPVQVDPELAVAETDSGQLRRDRRRERLGGPSAGVVQLGVAAPHLGLCSLERRLRRLDRILAVLEGDQLLPGRRGPLQQLGEGLRAIAPPQLGQAVELRLDLLEPTRIGLDRGEEAAQLRCGLAQLQLCLPERVPDARELGSEPLERCDCSLGRRHEVGRTVAVVGRERCGRARCSLHELGHVPVSFTLGAQIVFVLGRDPGRILASAWSSARRAPASAASCVNSS